MRSLRFAAMAVFGALLTLPVSPNGAAPASAASPEELAADQAELARKFERLETLAKRIAELTEAEDPARAEQLRGTIRKSQQLSLPDRFDAIVRLLEQEQLAAASKDQAAIADQLRVLLQLLLADPDEASREAERKRLREMRKALNRHIRSQQGLRRAALGDEDEGAIADRQEGLAEEVGKLGEQADPKSDAKAASSKPADAKAGDGQPQENQPQPGQPQPGQPQPGQPQQGQPAGSPSESQGPTSPTQRATQRIAEARQRMIEAVEELRKQDRAGAEGKQADAQRRLEDAREEIEQALRQLREEEMQRRLAKLATRLRRMLAEQIDVRRLTEQTEEDRPNRGRRATKIAATGLANREGQLVLAADSALRLLLEDGKSIAYPEVIGQIQDDMRTITGRLRDGKLARVTQRLEDDVIESLEEAVDSLDKTLEELEERKNQGRQGQQGGSPGEPPVVDKLAELRMIRAIQARILRRTTFWEEVRAAGEAEASEAADALNRLADRELKIIRAIKSLGAPAGG